MHVRVPPLRERAGDATLLAQHFLQMYSTRFSKPVLPLSTSSIGWIDTYQWPGNIRELKTSFVRRFCSRPGLRSIAPFGAGASLQEAESWSYRRANNTPRRVRTPLSTPARSSAPLAMYRRPPG